MGHFLGVHVARAHPDYYFCLLNEAREVRTLEKGHLDEVLAYASGSEMRAVAVDAPAKLNVGLMRQAAFRDLLVPPPAAGRWTDVRAGEYALIQQKMKVSRTSAVKGACPQWIQRGIHLHKSIGGLGYAAYPGPGEKLQLETPAEASFHCLLGSPLLSMDTTEGRIQRQLLLWRVGVQVDDPMLAFEEVTRYKLERGKFPYRGVLGSGQLLATMAAFVAWLAVHRPHEIQTFGRAEEGLLAAPVQLIHS